MDHTHLILEAEMGCSHLLSTMETASATLVIIMTNWSHFEYWLMKSHAI